MSEFPTRLRELRLKDGRSQRVLSDLCGLHPCAVFRYETGRAVPTVAALVALADYFGVSLDHLLGRDGP